MSVSADAAEAEYTGIPRLRGLQTEVTFDGLLTFSSTTGPTCPTVRWYSVKLDLPDRRPRHHIRRTTMNGREDEGETIVRRVVFVYLRGVLRSIVNFSGRELFHKRPRRTVRGTVHSNILRKSGVIDSVTRIIRLISRLHHDVIEVNRFGKLDLDPFPGGRTVVMTTFAGVHARGRVIRYLRPSGRSFRSPSGTLSSRVKIGVDLIEHFPRFVMRKRAARVCHVTFCGTTCHSYFGIFQKSIVAACTVTSTDGFQSVEFGILSGFSRGYGLVRGSSATPPSYLHIVGTRGQSMIGFEYQTAGSTTAAVIRTTSSSTTNHEDVNILR